MRSHNVFLVRRRHKKEAAMHNCSTIDKCLVIAYIYCKDRSTIFSQGRYSMPRRKKGWSKLSAWLVVVLGLAAGVTMNLVTAWLQKDVISNALYFLLVIFLLGAIIYSARKVRTPDFLNNVFWFLVATVSLNLFSTWVQYSVLHDTYTLPSVTLFLSFSVIALSISGLIQSNYYGRFK